MKLVIDIPDYDIEQIKECYEEHDIVESTYSYIYHGQPLSEILDKIRAEIKALSNANPSYWHSGDMVERDDVLEILDKYKGDSK